MHFPQDFTTTDMVDKLRLSPILDTDEDMYGAIDTFIDTIKRRQEGDTYWLPGPQIIIQCPGEFTQMCVTKYFQKWSNRISYHSSEPTTYQYLYQHYGQRTFKGTSILEIRLGCEARKYTETGISNIIRDNAIQYGNDWTPIITTVGDKNGYGMIKSWRFIRLKCEPATADDW